MQLLFLPYMEWRDKACFEAHIATPHVKHTEDRLKREEMLIETGLRPTMALLSTLRVNFTAWQTVKMI